MHRVLSSDLWKAIAEETWGIIQAADTPIQMV